MIDGLVTEDKIFSSFFLRRISDIWSLWQIKLIIEDNDLSLNSFVAIEEFFIDSSGLNDFLSFFTDDDLIKNLGFNFCLFE